MLTIGQFLDAVLGIPILSAELKPDRWRGAQAHFTRAHVDAIAGECRSSEYMSPPNRTEPAAGSTRCRGFSVRATNHFGALST